MQIVTPIIKECDHVNISIDGKKVAKGKYLLYPAIFGIVIDGSTLWNHYVNKVDLVDHVIKAVVVKDSTEEVLFERKLSYETLQWLAERRAEEKLIHNTWYGGINVRRNLYEHIMLIRSILSTKQ